MEQFKTIIENTTAEIVEKKSKFIANVYYVQSVEEAEEIIKQNRKKYFDARHNCFAYRIIAPDGIKSKASDDGEPSGTAGAPMLNILVQKEIANTLVIVTRYFGGILLGTGGLVRAYSEATTKALENAKYGIEEQGMELEIHLEYKDLEKIKYYCGKNNIKIVNIQYETQIKCIIEVNSEEKEKILTDEQICSCIIKALVIKNKNIRKNLDK